MYYKKNGFIFDESVSIEGSSIYINSDNISKCIKYIQSNNIKSVQINSSFGFNSKDLSFLKDIPFIEELIISNDNIDVTPVNNLSELKYLIIQTICKQDLIFDNFLKLENCNIIYNKHIINLKNSRNLKYLVLQNYLFENMNILSELNELQSLYLIGGQIKYLDGIEYCKNLHSITLEYLNKLESLDAIKSIIQNIKELAIRNCKNIKSYDVIEDGLNLETLYIISSAATKNIAFIENLKKIKYGNIDIDILDGNVKFLLDLPIIFKNYKHFSDKNTLKIKSIINDGNYLTRNGKILYKLQG